MFLPFVFLALWISGLIFILCGKRIPAVFLVLVCCFLLGAALYQKKSFEVQALDPLALQFGFDRPAAMRLKGRIVEYSRSRGEGERTSLLLDVDAASRCDDNPSWVSINGRTMVNWYEGGEGVLEGDQVEVFGKLRLLKGFKNPGVFDYERYMHRRGIYTRMSARGPDAVSLVERIDLSSPAGWRYFLRRQASVILSDSVWTKETTAFLSAILLGDRDLLTDEMKDWFKQTGTFHILAISGLHVGLVYLLVSVGLTSLRFDRKWRTALALLIVWSYALITGAGVPVMRASLMLTLVLAGYLLDREGDFLTAVAAAAFVLFLMDPLSIDDVSSQLSFTAVILLCVSEPLFSGRLYPALQERFPWALSPILHKLVVTLYASVIVGIGLTPIVAYHFNQVSLVFPFANLLVVPLLSFLLAFGFATLAVGSISIQAAAVPGFGAEIISQIMFGIVRFFSGLPFSFARIGSPPYWVLVLTMLGILIAWWRTGWRRKLVVFGCCAAVGIMSASSGRLLSDGVFRMTVFDVGEADSCFIESPERKTMLVDCGFSTPSLDCGEQLIAPFLWRKNIRKIDTLVLTHPDADHYGGAGFILEHFKVGKLLLPDIAQWPPAFLEIVERARERGIRIEYAAAGDVFEVDSVTRAEVLNPSKSVSQKRYSTNEISLVMRISCGDFSFLLAGDAEEGSLRDMQNCGKTLRSTILKVPHHGLASSFSRPFMQQVEPELAIISGRAFRVNDSIQRRIIRYAPYSGRVLATERDGAVVIEILNDSLRVSACRRTAF
ncbi:MAG: DNA internalization-related competence protein ComEC/Rec2 [Candidatus Abyssobacteria bacterium SURF_5]|uniref:DNA internalization-related competence protein ComEC/Rec2 n=1 Tax=Abyssobacteria bacterium (strain SURF_5) TaxID=2093360 RepID=A0A3A4P2E2_ABYX5|nr:MAG: DNA internalization-related competence protein ComEC/Rec2 [Candidatus Abyssubacteria bacterium SURF_5]